MIKQSLVIDVLMTSILVFLLSIPAAAQFHPGGEVFFDNGRDALDILFELNSDKIYLNVMLNDSGPFWLVLDTGSPGMILDTRIGNELGQVSLEQVRQLFRRQAGTTYQIVVERDGRHPSITLTLRKVI